MSLAAALLFPGSSPEKLLEAVLDVSLTGINLLSPRYGPSGELEDFAIEYLSPAAQRMAGLPERPGGTLLTRFPNSVASGIFDYYRRAYEASVTDIYQVNYQAEGLDNYFRLAARRSGELLVVSFTDTGDEDRSPVEEALRQAQAAEKTARAEAEAQRFELQNVFEQAPIALARLRGPEFVVEWANARMGQIWGRSLDHILGQPHFQALPDLAGQGFEAVFAGVLQTGEPYYFRELLVAIEQAQQPYQGYFNITFQPAYDEQGHITGLIASAIEVTDQVQARQQVEQLNQELEARVQERTQQAQAALAETEAQRTELQRVFEQAPVAIAIVRGPEFIVELANPVMGELWGRPPAQVIGRPHFEALPDARGQGLEQIFSRVLETGEPFFVTEMPVNLAREQAGLPARGYFNCSWLPLRDGQRQITGLIIVGMEVTGQVLARQRAEALQAEVLAAAQRQSQEREAFHQIFEQTPALIALLRTPGHRFEYVNPAYQRLFPGRQLLGLDVEEAVPALREQGFIALLDQVYQTGETYFGSEHLFAAPAHQGQPAYEAYFNFTYQAYQENGQTAGISIFAYEVTQQVRARQEHEAQRQQLHTLFMKAPAPIVILDGAELVYQLVNPAYQQIFPGRQLLGKPLLEALPELAGTEIPAILSRVYQTGETFVAQELPLMLARHEGGPLEEIYWTFTYQARHNERGQVDGVLVFAHEVTDQVKARKVVEKSERQAQALAQELAASNEELQAANEQVQASNEDLGQANTQLQRTNVDLDTFIYTASHDLRAPIDNIEGLMRVLVRQLPKESLQAEPVRETLAFIEDSVGRFKRTIANLTAVVKLQKEADQPTVAADLASITRAVLLDLTAQIEESGAQVIVEISESTEVSFSEKNLRSVVFNLLSNAIKYRSPDRSPVVRIHCQSSGGYELLTVADNGLGMDLVRGRKLFSMFQRFHTHVEGSGIGLYMVKRMIENAGGKIEVESQVGVGSTFRVYFTRYD